jgi:hypothetical protein
MLPTLRVTNTSPGAALVIATGSIRESAQVMNSVCGRCRSLAACTNTSACAG